MLRSDLIIAGSNFIFNHINTNYSKYLNTKKKLMVIFRGINTDYFSKKNISEAKIDKLISSWKIEKDKTTILLPGRITKWKGQEMFIEAINILSEDFYKTNFQAIILGSDQGRKVYSKKLIGLIERYQLGKKIKFFNHCREMPTAYAISDIIVSSSIEPEAFGRVSVEAQSMKRPIIASDIGGSKETIIDNRTGLLFKSEDPKSLSEKIDNIFRSDDTTLNAMGNNGRKNVEQKFNVEKMCFSTYSEYKKLINA